MTEPTAKNIECQHNRLIVMEWPGGGQSDLCIKCLMTRYHSEFDSTEWQDHEYKSVKDWYFEAAELQAMLEGYEND